MAVASVAAPVAVAVCLPPPAAGAPAPAVAVACLPSAAAAANAGAADLSEGAPAVAETAQVALTGFDSLESIAFQLVVTGWGRKDLPMRMPLRI